MSFPHHVLLVEDSEIYRHYLRGRLEALGLTVRDADDLIPAIEFIEVEDFDLVITDDQLPSGTGADLLAYVHNRQPLLPVVVMSSHVDDELRRRAVHADAVCDKDTLVALLPVLVATPTAA